MLFGLLALVMAVAPSSAQSPSPVPAPRQPPPALSLAIDATTRLLVVAPHPDDDHPDHCSTHIFVREALVAVPPIVAQRVRVLHYLVHYDQWPLSADAGVGAVMDPPADFPPSEGRWVSFALTTDEAAAKKRALLQYTTQMQVIGRFITAFGRDNELFIEGDPASPPECWCDGENVATQATPAQYRRRPRRQ